MTHNLLMLMAGACLGAAFAVWGREVYRSRQAGGVLMVGIGFVLSLLLAAFIGVRS
jgi:hypothetical protein